MQDAEEVSHADKLSLGGKDAERMRKRVTSRVPKSYYKSAEQNDKDKCVECV